LIADSFAYCFILHEGLISLILSFSLTMFANKLHFILSKVNHLRSVHATASPSLRSFVNDRCVELKGHNHFVNCVHVMPDGMTIVSGSDDNTVKVWNSHDNSCIMTIPCPDWVRSLVAIDDQTILAGLGDGKIVKIKIDLSSGHRSIVSTWTGHSNIVMAMALLHDGYTVLSGSCDETLKLWDSRDGSCLATLRGHSDSVYCLSLIPPSPSSSSSSSDHHQLAVSGSKDNTLIIWDLNEMKAIKTLRGHIDFVYSVACLSYDRIVSGSDDNSIRLWDVIRGHCLHVMNGHANSVSSLAVLPSDVIASGSYDKTIKIWQVSTGQQLQTLSGHRDSVRCLSDGFSCLSVPGDGRLVSGSDDSTLRIWS